MELEGLGATGVFVSELAEGGRGTELLQVGDQILEVNGQSVGEIRTIQSRHCVQSAVFSELPLRAGLKRAV